MRAASSILVHLGLGALSDRTTLAEIARVAALECTFLPARHIQRVWPVCQENMLQTWAWRNALPVLQAGIKIQCKVMHVKPAPKESTVTIHLLVSQFRVALIQSIALLVIMDVQRPNFAQKEHFATARHQSRYHAHLVKQRNFKAWPLVSQFRVALIQSIALPVTMDVQTPNFVQKEHFAMAQHQSRYHVRLVKQQSFEAWHLVQSAQ